MAAGYPTDAQIQAKLDTSDGRGIRIMRSCRVSSTLRSIYLVPVVSYPGQSKWYNAAVSSVASTASAASIIAAAIVTSMRA